jgi:hypothetical protein
MGSEAMETKHVRSPWTAGILSGLFPGLGQFYNRQWWKGAGFLVGLLVVDGLLGVSAGFFRLLQAILQGNSSEVLPEDLAQLLLRSLAPLVVAVWSLMDAVLVARKS